MRKGFKELGFNILEAQTAIVPVIIGEDMNTFVFWRALFDAGVFVNAFVSPGVPAGMAMLRTSYMATHEGRAPGPHPGDLRDHRQEARRHSLTGRDRSPASGRRAPAACPFAGGFSGPRPTAYHHPHTLRRP